jgi:hypothetical protein
MFSRSSAMSACYVEETPAAQAERFAFCAGELLRRFADQFPVEVVLGLGERHALGGDDLRGIRIAGANIQAATTSSVQTLKLSSVFGPNVLDSATSQASRPRAINTRPMRGVLLRASKMYQRSPR